MSELESRLHAEHRRRMDETRGPNAQATSQAVAEALNAFFCSLERQYAPQPIPEDVLGRALRELGFSSIMVLSRT
jgi:hypothetical protein